VGVLDADRRLVPDADRVKGRCLGTNPAASPVALRATVDRGIVERTELVARDERHPLVTAAHTVA